MSNIDDDLGKHPADPNFFFAWMDAKNITPSALLAHKKYRSLTEKKAVHKAAVDEAARWVITHLIRNSTIIDLQRKKKQEIYRKYSYDKYLKAQRYLPQATDPNTQSGNLTEIVFSEYLQACTGYSPLIYKLRYNSNTSQSMKGDDILLFNRDKLEEKIILGECKFRAACRKQDIDEILESLGGSTKMPLSMTFVANSLKDDRQRKLSNDISMLQAKMYDGRVPVVNVGLMLSNQDTYKDVNKHEFYGDYSINKLVIDALTDAGYDAVFLSTLIGTTFKTLPQLNKRIDDMLEKLGRQKLTKDIKDIIKDTANKSFNPNLSFISISMDDPVLFVKEVFQKAEEYLLHIDRLKRPKGQGLFDAFIHLSIADIYDKVKNLIKP